MTADDDRLIWRASRTRVFPPRTYENPWSRTGSQARAVRALVETLRGAGSFYEEAEDWDTVAPPRPTITYCPVTVTPLHIEEWYSPEAAQELLDKDLGITSKPKGSITSAARPANSTAAIDRWTPPPQKPGWTFSLDDWWVFADLEALEKEIHRKDGCWFAPGLYWRVDNRLVRTHLAMWAYQHGEVTSSTVLRRTCKKKDCCNPHHHEEV